MCTHMKVERFLALELNGGFGGDKLGNGTISIGSERQRMIESSFGER